MANIIDHTYFIRDINLPHAGTAEGLETLNSFIDIYEKEFLQSVLGYELWKAFTDDIATDPVDQRFIDLRDGKEFTDFSGHLIKWEGFKNSQKISPIANYVYVKFAEASLSQTTTIGEVKATSENSVSNSPAVKMSIAWNRMVDSLRILAEFLEVNRIIYPEWQNHAYPYYMLAKTNPFGI